MQKSFCLMKNKETRETNTVCCVCVCVWGWRGGVGGGVLDLFKKDYLLVSYRTRSNSRRRKKILFGEFFSYNKQQLILLGQ